jgi:hypothetical protein
LLFNKFWGGILTDIINENVELEVRKVKTKKPSTAKEKDTTDIENIIGSSTRQNRKRPSNMGEVSDGIIGSKTAIAPTKVHSEEPKNEIEKIAIFSTKNIFWNGVGKIYKGYNIVTKDQSENWLTKSCVRIATPEEVAQELKN